MNAFPGIQRSYTSLDSDPKLAKSEPTHGPLQVGVKEEGQSPPPFQAQTLFPSSAAEPVRPFDPDSVFNRESSAQVDSQDEPAPSDRYVREII